MPQPITPQSFVSKWKHANLSERASAQEQILERLLALNLERAAGQGEVRASGAGAEDDSDTDEEQPAHDRRKKRKQGASANGLLP